jgi:hypothetical protein
VRRLRSQSRTRDIMALGGWLFADLLLALAMLFFTTSVDVKSLSTTPTPMPTPKSPPRLALKQIRIHLTIDANGVLQNVPGAVNNIKQQMRRQAFLRGRSVGFVIAYGGAHTVDQINTALTLAQKVYGILKNLGREWSVFSRASYYDPLYLLGGDLNIVTLDIYLFAKR